MRVLQVIMTLIILHFKTSLSIASVAKRNKIGLSICGEVASDPDMIPLLIGLGYDEFSMTPQSVLEVKSKIISLLYKECRKIALEATKMKTGRQVRNLLKGNKMPSFLGIKLGKTKDES